MLRLSRSLCRKRDKRSQSAELLFVLASATRASPRQRVAGEAHEPAAEEGEAVQLRRLADVRQTGEAW
jgi:hypothetical protein